MPVVLAAVHGSLGLPGWHLFRGFTFLSPFSHSSPSLIGLLASVDAKQQKLTFFFFFFFFFLTGGTYARDVVYADRRDTTNLDPADHMGLNRPETEPNSVTG